MMEKLKSIKIDVTLSAVLSVVIGVMLIFWPGTIITLLAQVIAVILMIAGLVLLVPQIFSPVRSALSMIVSALIALIGLWMFLSPETIASLIPIAIGVLLVAHGIQDLVLAFEGKQKKANNWWSIPLMGLLNIALGVLCIANAFGLVKLGMILIGVMMVYDGLTDMFIVHKVNKASKIIDSEITKEENVDYDDFV